MKQLITILLSFIGYVSLFGQTPMVVAGEMQVSGPVYSQGAVHVFVDTINSRINIDNATATSAELRTDTIIFYSNDKRDGLLLSQKTGGVKGTITDQPAKVIVRKNVADYTWTYITLPFDVNISDISKNGVSLKAEEDYWLARFDAKARSDSSTTNVNVVWPYFDDYNGTLQKGTGYMVAGYFGGTPGVTLGDIDFVTTNSTDINNLFKVEDKSVNYRTYVSSAGAWKEPDRGDGWAFIGGLNPTTFSINKDNIGNYSDDAAAVYPVNGTSQVTAVTLIGKGINETVKIGPYTPFYIHIVTDTKIAAYPIDSTFIFKRGGLSLDNYTYRSANENIKDQLYFALSSDKDNSFDRFYLTFADHYSESFKTSEDAITMMTFSKSSPAVWCLDGANKELALNGLPMKDERKVGMGFSVPEAGDYTFRLDAKKLADVRNVILVDNVTGKKVDLLQTLSYSFNSEAVEIENNRFTLYINSSYTDIPLVDTDKPYAYAKDNILTIKNLSEGDMVSVYDLSGRTLVSGKVSGMEFSTVLSQKGVYIVNVKMKNGQTSVFKVLNK
jgi:hypothetical protein